VAQGVSIAVPILMYHHIAIPPDNADAIRRDLSVPPERFDEMMAYFAAKGYHSVKIGDVYDALYNNKSLPANPIVITFDDGYDDMYTNALPILQKYNFIGTFYIPTGLLERPGYMTWAQVEALAKAGMDIESHSVTHPSLKGKPLAFLRTEIGDSKAALEAHLGTKIYFFCYPSGQYDALTIQVLQEFGYLSATTTWGGVYENSESPFEWTRVRVHGDDKVADLVDRISSYYQR
jgi:peptidoglycan/xylan/chitin deacetylase (PgdA/CDA1 family)